MASLVALGVPPTLAFPLLVGFQCIADFGFFKIIGLHLANHDSRHFVVDPVSLLIDDIAALEGIDGDDPEPFEEALVVDPVAAPLKEVVLIGVIVLDEHFPIGTFLTKEGAGMRDNFIVEEAGTKDKDLPVSVGGGQLVHDELLESGKRLLVLELSNLNDRKRMVILDKEVSEGSDRDAIIDLLGIDIAVACAQRLFPEPLNLLSLDEEAMAQELVDRVGEAVVEHGLLVQDLLGGDESIGEHEILGLVLDDLIVGVEEALGE